MRRGYARSAQRAHIRRVEAAGRERDLSADPAALNDSELTGSIYRLQQSRRVRDDELAHAASAIREREESIRTRIRALLAEKDRRRAS